MNARTISRFPPRIPQGLRSAHRFRRRPRFHRRRSRPIGRRQNLLSVPTELDSWVAILPDAAHRLLGKMDMASRSISRSRRSLPTSWTSPSTRWTSSWATRRSPATRAALQAAPGFSWGPGRCATRPPRRGISSCSRPRRSSGFRRSNCASRTAWSARFQTRQRK